MAISFPVTPPDNEFRLGEFGADFNNIDFLSLNRSRQVIARAGDLLTLSIELPPKSQADAQLWSSWLMSLRGSFGTFYCWDPVQKIDGPLGAYGGTPLVNGASQTGYSLVIDGASNSITGWAKAGDWVEVNGLYRMVTEDANSDGSGNVTLSISPGIGEGQSPADNAPVTTGADAKGTFRLTSNRVKWSVNTIRHYGFRFDAIEAI